MDVLDRLRTWLGGGTAEPEAESESDGLDPDNVTEVRSDADDEAVEKLRTLRENEADDDGSA